MLINKWRCRKKPLEYHGYTLVLLHREYEKRVFHYAIKTGGPPALGNWGAKQEL
jgi:hypothetical protein